MDAALPLVAGWWRGGRCEQQIPFGNDKQRGIACSSSGFRPPSVEVGVDAALPLVGMACSSSASADAPYAADAEIVALPLVAGGLLRKVERL